MEHKLVRIETLLLTVLTKIDYFVHQKDKIYTHRIINIEKDVYRLKLGRIAPSSAPPLQPRLHPQHGQQYGHWIM